MEKSKVYFTRDISPAGLLKAYRALGVTLNGKVAVKLSTGEPGGHNFLQPTLIAELVKEVNGTIVECNTAYGGGRSTNADHWQTMKDHGFTAIAPCDLMDEEGDMALPVRHGKHMEENFVGSHLSRYQSMLMLSHFKGHAMGGFGGALKNMSIGVASAWGKALIHACGDEVLAEEACFAGDHNGFLESMAEADQSVMNYMGWRNIVYVNVANRLSVDCDCDSHPAEPEMADIGIFASLDPVAIDQASVDAVYNSPDPGKAALIERMESRNAMLTLQRAEELELGNREYDLIDLDEA